jgi:hypothetical protein
MASAQPKPAFDRERAHLGSTQGPPACEAWQLLVRFALVQRANLPAVAATLELSPAQCHLLHVIEPDRPMPMGQLAGALACDASNVTGQREAVNWFGA